LSKSRPKDNRLKSGNKKINVLGNAIIAENWYVPSHPLSEQQLTSRKGTKT
jgi:hypothetical protein